jgi:hypothetical protein
MSLLLILSGQGKYISVVSSDDVLHFDDHVGLGLCASEALWHMNDCSCVLCVSTAFCY